jgi:hypothetical protein
MIVFKYDMITLWRSYLIIIIEPLQCNILVIIGVGNCPRMLEEHSGKSEGLLLVV